MDISREDYHVEDFISDESFVNYHFKSDKSDELFWKEWLLKHPEKMPLAREARKIINELSFNISEKEFQQELKKIRSVIGKDDKQSLFKIPIDKKSFESKRRKRKILLYVLPLLFVVVVGGYFLFQSLQSNSTKLIATTNNSRLPMVLTLSDSTVVSLAPNSSLEYPLHFKDKERIVYLHGNAQFNVKRNTAHPFKVHAENMVATVLGTVFNIKNAGDSAMTVELLKGKLNVEIMDAAMKPEQSVLLIPNERAVYVRNEKHLYKNLIQRENHLYFHQNNFDEVAAKIKNAFGITLINESNKKSWRFTGEFENTTAKDIIESICLVKKLSFTAKADTIFIK